MAISDQVIEQIRMSSDIVSVIGDYVPDLKKAGRNWKACCPFHTEKTPSFMVNPEKGIFKCFGCGVAGDVFKFVTLIENISWIEAVRKLAQKSGIVIEEDFSQNRNNIYPNSDSQNNSNYVPPQINFFFILG